MVLRKFKSLSPLATYLMGSAIAIIAGLFSEVNVYIYYALLFIAIAFVIWGVAKYFSKTN